MKKITNIKSALTPKKSLTKQISWVPEKIETFPKSPNSSLTIALIASDRVYWSMQHEGHVLTVTETNWQWLLKHGEVDLLLIESCAETSTGDWFMSQTATDLSGSVFGQMVATAYSYDIPVAYWFTLDEAYLPQYEPVIQWMDKVFCADDRVVSALTNKGKTVTYLPPAVQPALFSKMNEYTPEKRDLKRVVCDDLVSVIQRWDGHSNFYKEIQDFGGYFFDSRNQIWNVKANKLDLKQDRVLGSVDVKARAAILKESRTLGILKSDSRTLTDLKWSALEAAASHTTVLLEPGLDLREFSSLCLKPNNQDQFFVELIRHDKDILYYERVAQKAWRHALMNHTFSHRIRTICKQLGLYHDWVEFPSAAMITPSHRKKFLERAKESFSTQTYPNKHWVMAFNGPMEDFSEIKEKVQKIENSQAIYVPEELHAGPCMNAGIQKAPADYVFRMDDDDYYGPNYLLDMILYLRIISYDVVGKVFRFWHSTDLSTSSVFERKNLSLSFDKPSCLFNGQTPEGFSFLAGCSQGLRKQFSIKNPFPQKNFGTVDSQFLDSLRQRKTGTIVSVDSLNLIVDRRLAKDHTWHVNLDMMKDNSKEINLDFNGVSFV